MYGNKKQEDICQNRFGKDLPVLFSETFQKLLLLLLHSLQFRQNQNQHGDKAETSADYV